MASEASESTKSNGSACGAGSRLSDRVVWLPPIGDLDASSGYKGKDISSAARLELGWFVDLYVDDR